MSVSLTRIEPASRPASGAAVRSAAAGADMQGTCAVRLIDRRTGAVHRINGTPLLILTRDPQTAAAELLDGRDPTLWEARIEPFADGPRNGKQPQRGRRR